MRQAVYDTNNSGVIRVNMIIFHLDESCFSGISEDVTQLIQYFKWISFMTENGYSFSTSVASNFVGVVISGKAIYICNAVI